MSKAFEDLKKGYSENVSRETEEQELSAEDKALLETEKIETLSARLQIRLAYLRNKGGKSSE